jgi:hypothetical protein
VEDLLRKEWETNYKSSTTDSVRDTAVHVTLHHLVSPLANYLVFVWYADTDN